MKTYRGSCALCSAPVRVTADFLSCHYFTCNMDDSVELGRQPHAGWELERFWFCGRRDLP